MFDSIIPFDVVVCSVFLTRLCSYCPFDLPYSTPYLSLLHSLKVPCDCSDIVYIRVSLQNNSFGLPLTLPLCNISLNSVLVTLVNWPRSFYNQVATSGVDFSLISIVSQLPPAWTELIDLKRPPQQARAPSAFRLPSINLTHFSLLQG